MQYKHNPLRHMLAYATPDSHKAKCAYCGCTLRSGNKAGLCSVHARALGDKVLDKLARNNGMMRLAHNPLPAEVPALIAEALRSRKTS